MQKHTKIYFNHFGIYYDQASGWHDPIPCENCGFPAVDIHHIEGRIGEHANHINNLIALCRKCHDKAHSKEIDCKELVKQRGV